jgi:hypothetical protein
MRILMLKSKVCGGVFVNPGDVVEASSADAFYLLATKAAVRAPDGEIAEESPKRGRKKAPENRMISGEELENRGIE